MNKSRFIFFWLLSVCALYGQTPDPLKVFDVEAQQKWVDSVYTSLTLEEKIGQLFMVMAFSERGEEHFNEIEKNIEVDKIGGIIFSLGGPIEQTQWLNQFQEKTKVPLLIGMDAEWGVAMRLDSVQPFPWNMTLGAIQDNRLIEAIGNRIGTQAKRLGIHINFAPTVDINTNPENPIIGNRSFGEDKYNVAKKSSALIKGMHASGVFSSAKHFPGHGDTSTDSHLGLPTINFSSERINDIELFPFKRMIQDGVSSVMVAHLDVLALDKGVPSSLSYKIVQTLLKDSLNFKGLVISDALNMKGAAKANASLGIDVEAFLAGNDILLIPNDVSVAIRKMKRAIKTKKISEERLAYSVKKILKAKYKVRLHEEARVSLHNLYEDLNTIEDDYLITKAIRSAITVVKNKNNILPLDPSKPYGYLKLGDDDGSLFKKLLSEDLEIHTVEASHPNAFILKELEPYSDIVIGFHRSSENPWKASHFSEKEIELLKALSEKHNIVLDIFVNPYALNKLDKIETIDGIVVSYQNNDIAQEASAEIILGKRAAFGRLPVSVSTQYKPGDGIDLKVSSALEKGDPLDVGFDPKRLAKVDTLAQLAIDSLMTPGMQILVARHGKIVYNKSFGYHTYKKKIPVKNTDIYDLASLTKILATIPLLIKEVDENKLDLNSSLGSLNPEWEASNKADITVQDILSHYARLTPWIPFYKATLKEGTGKLDKKFYRKRRNNRYPISVAEQIYGRNNLKDIIKSQVIESELRDTLEYKYSDLPYFFMKDLLELRYKEPLDVLADKKIYKPLGLVRTAFNPNINIPNQTIVPSEIDTYYRKQELKGEVHDMAAAMLGGVGGHAGLFSNAEEVAIIMQLFLQKGTYANKKYFSEDSFDKFNRCLYCDKGNRRGVGFDKPQLEGRGSTCGCVPRSSFGHSGFTGTYAWADPENELVYVFLSNRTYPSMENNLLLKHDIRTRIQQYIYDAIIN